MGKIFAGVSLMVLSLGVVSADEWIAQITKVDGKKITAKAVKFDKDNAKGAFGKGKDMFKDVESKTYTCTADVKVVKKGKAESTPVEDGLKNKMFTDATEDAPVTGFLTTNDKGEVTEISLFGKGKGGKKKDTSAN